MRLSIKVPWDKLDESVDEITRLHTYLTFFRPFENGSQTFKTWFKIIYSLPKLLFLRAIWQCIKRN